MAKNRKLTDREREILELVATGGSNRQIAQQLHISSNTVKVHLRNIFEKLGVASRTEATLYAIQAGLVEGVESGVVTAERSWWQRGWVIAVGALILTMVALLVGVLVNPGESPPENVVDLEQLERDRWQELAPMPTARKGLAVAAYDGQIYAIAGETEDGVTDVVERYDPATDTWETLPPKPTAVTDVQAAVIGGKIYVPGGCIKNEIQTSALEIYDPAGGKWTQGASLPQSLCSYGVVAFEGNVYLFGGRDRSNYLSSVYMYDPIEDTWVERYPMQSPRADVDAVVSSGVIFVMGGVNGSGYSPANSVYQPELDQQGNNPWVDKAPIPLARSEMGLGSTADIVYLLGGLGDDPTIQGFRYIPRLDEWTAVDTPFNAIWSNMGTAILEGEFFAFGGEEGNDQLDRSVVYRMVYTVLIPIIR